MAISTVDGILAGAKNPYMWSKVATPTLVAGRPHSLFYLAGIPGAGSACSAGITGEVLTAVAGQLPFTNPGAGYSYLSRFSANAPIVGSVLLCDRLWQNSGITITSTAEQTFTSSVQIPARDINQTNNGVGVFAAVEVSGATGAGTPTLTLKYNNQAGTADKTATNVDATVATSAIGAFYRIGLAAGDTGIQKAQSLTLSATWTSGTIHVVLYTVLARVQIPYGNYGASIDAISGGFPRLADNTCPFMVFIPGSTTASQIFGDFAYTQG